MVMDLNQALQLTQKFSGFITSHGLLKLFKNAFKGRNNKTNNKNNKLNNWFKHLASHGLSIEHLVDAIYLYFVN